MLYYWFMWYIGWVSLGVIFLVTGLFITFAMCLPLAAVYVGLNALLRSRLFLGPTSTFHLSTASPVRRLRNFLQVGRGT